MFLPVLAIHSSSLSYETTIFPPRRTNLTMNRTLFTLSTLLLCVTIALAQPDQPWLKKIDPVLLDNARSGQSLDMLLVFQPARIALAEAKTIRGKNNKSTFVFTTLRDHAKTTQRDAITFLNQRSIPHLSLWVANVIRVECDEATMHQLAQLSSVIRIIENSEMQSITPIDESPASPSNRGAVEWGIDRINADDVWALGYTGQGVVVGGQDTGYEWDHPALKRRYRGYIETADTVDHNYNWHDAIHAYDTLHNDSNNICGLDVQEPCDDSGHGTHTMGTMIGQDTNRMIGVAPDATWCGCRNMERGYGRLHTYLECFQWFIAPTDLNNENPDPSKSPSVINNSWGCPPIEGCNASNWHILDEAVEASRLAGIVVVASAGNSGSSCGSVSSPPAIFEGTFSVGATAINDTIVGFSSRGPVTVDSSFRIKPNVSAPGLNVVSARPGGQYGSSLGTSMASPHVAGTVALMISANPILDGEVELIEDIIEQTAVPKTTDQQCGEVPGSEVPNNTYGYGRIDALAAVEMA
jgi:serine protease AprX